MCFYRRLPKLASWQRFAPIIGRIHFWDPGDPAVLSCNTWGSTISNVFGVVVYCRFIRIRYRIDLISCLLTCLWSCDISASPILIPCVWSALNGLLTCASPRLLSASKLIIGYHSASNESALLKTLVCFKKFIAKPRYLRLVSCSLFRLLRYRMYHGRKPFSRRYGCVGILMYSDLLVDGGFLVTQWPFGFNWRSEGIVPRGSFNMPSVSNKKFIVTSQLVVCKNNFSNVSYRGTGALITT